MTFVKEIPCAVRLTEFYSHIFLYTDLFMVIISSIYGYRSLWPGVMGFNNNKLLANEIQLYSNIAFVHCICTQFLMTSSLDYSINY